MSEDRLKIEFSKNGEGAVLMTAIGTSLYLDKPKRNDLTIGDMLKLNDEFEPLAELKFYKTETIDILIEKLVSIKNNIILNSIG